MEVLMAEPYRALAMSSTGDARYMLIRQYQFPHEYAQRDKLISADSDRCFEWNPDHATRCFREHTNTGELNLESWIQGASDDEIINFLKDLLKANTSIRWTGYRILGTVNCSNGFPVWSFQLFGKHPESRTRVYTGPNAPNVRRAVARGEIDIEMY